MVYKCIISVNLNGLLTKTPYFRPFPLNAECYSNGLKSYNK